MENLLIGTRGWQHKSWLGTFYPDDMPEDWQLDYYSNILSCVLISEVEWSTWDKEWLDEVVEMLEDEAFYFYFEVSTTDNLAVLDLIKAALADQAKGLLVFDKIDMTGLNAVETFDVTFVSEKMPDSDWSWQSGEYYLSGSPLGWINALPEEGKAQATLLTSFMQSLPQEQIGAPFLIANDEIDMNQIKNLKVIAEISGY